MPTVVLSRLGLFDIDVAFLLWRSSSGGRGPRPRRGAGRCPAGSSRQPRHRGNCRCTEPRRDDSDAGDPPAVCRPPQGGSAGGHGYKHEVGLVSRRGIHPASTYSDDAGDTPSGFGAPTSRPVSTPPAALQRRPRCESGHRRRPTHAQFRGASLTGSQGLQADSDRTERRRGVRSGCSPSLAFVPALGCRVSLEARVAALHARDQGRRNGALAVRDCAGLIRSDGDAIRQARLDGLAVARQARIDYRRTTRKPK